MTPRIRRPVPEDAFGEPDTDAALLETVRRNGDLIEVGIAFREIVRRHAGAEETIADAVAGMRQRSATWQSIAAALGMSVEAAQERYGQPRTD